MSKTKLNDATYSIHHLVKNSHISSYKTRADTEAILTKAIKDLHFLGYKLSHIQGLKQKHVLALVDEWKQRELNPGTMKNYMAKLRLACREMKKDNVVASNNDVYEIERRTYVSLVSKAIHDINLEKITDPYIKRSIEAQRLFGLRREESLKLNVSEAFKKDQTGYYLVLKGSWTKGGVSRQIPVRTEEQHQFLLELKKFTGTGSLIPKGVTNKQQINRYVTQTREAELYHLHGLRHAYAQKRYRELTDQLTHGAGWECPFNGGKTRQELTDNEKKIDEQARLILSNELGHSRQIITRIYCG